MKEGLWLACCLALSQGSFWCLSSFPFLSALILIFLHSPSPLPKVAIATLSQRSWHLLSQRLVGNWLEAKRGCRWACVLAGERGGMVKLTLKTTHSHCYKSQPLPHPNKTTFFKHKSICALPFLLVAGSKPRLLLSLQKSSLVKGLV